MTPCVFFQGRMDLEGYGRMWDSRDGRVKYAHRLAWERSTGQRLTRLDVLHHRCRQKACVNVDHLELTTRWDHRRSHRGEGHPCEHGIAPACGACRKAANRQAQRAFQQRQRETERCAWCMQPRFGNTRLCREHRAHENAYARARRAARRPLATPRARAELGGDQAE